MNPGPTGVARRLIVLGAAAGVAVGVWRADRPRRIGAITVFPRPSPGVVPLFDAFFAGMREQGYEEGRDYVMDWRVTGGQQAGGVRRARRRTGGGPATSQSSSRSSLNC